MTANGFRRIALSLTGASESAHMHHPDFRAHGRIFASLGYPDKHWGMVKLSPAEQAAFVQDKSQAFVPVKGAWGRSGCTQVHLASVDEPMLRNALVAAWNKTAVKSAVRKSGKSAK